MESELTQEHLGLQLKEKAQVAYVQYCATYDAIVQLVDAMVDLNETWADTSSERPAEDFEEAVDKVYQAFFRLDRARATIDEGLGILIDNGIDVSRFPERL